MSGWMQKLFAVLALHKAENELDALDQDEDLTPVCPACGTILSLVEPMSQGHHCPVCGFDF